MRRTVISLAATGRRNAAAWSGALAHQLRITLGRYIDGARSLARLPAKGAELSLSC